MQAGFLCLFCVAALSIPQWPLTDPGTDIVDIFLTGRIYSVVFVMLESPSLSQGGIDKAA